MYITINGNYVSISFNAGEAQKGVITLPDGYSIETVFFNNVTNVRLFSESFLIPTGSRIHFPPVNSMSPASFLYRIDDTTKAALARFTIEKFGQIPTSHYFDKAFDPILVTGDDGNKYNVIPSDQFK